MTDYQYKNIEDYKSDYFHKIEQLVYEDLGMQGDFVIEDAKERGVMQAIESRTDVLCVDYPPNGEKADAGADAYNADSVYYSRCVKEIVKDWLHTQLEREAAKFVQRVLDNDFGNVVELMQLSASKVMHRLYKIGQQAGHLELCMEIDGIGLDLLEAAWREAVK